MPRPRNGATWPLVRFPNYRVPRQTGHFHSIGHGRLRRGRVHYAVGAWSNHRSRAVLRGRCLLPITVMGLAIRKHILQNFTRSGADLGRAWRRLCRALGCDGLYRSDRGQVGGRRLDSADHLDDAIISAHLLLCRRWIAIPSRSSALCGTRRASRVRWRPSSSGSR